MEPVLPVIGLTKEEYLSELPIEDRRIVEQIEQSKEHGKRAKPSACLIDSSDVLTKNKRKALLDKIAVLVDEEIGGRSDMCQQFALLLHLAFGRLGLTSRIVTGRAAYYDSTGNTVFTWNHDWVLLDNDELIDGNIDSIVENPRAREAHNLNISPYWGPRLKHPRDRKFNEDRGARTRPPDLDVDENWWPRLANWMDSELSNMI